MKQIKRHIGILLIVIGTEALALTRIAALNGSNTLLAAGLLLILAGTMMHIHSIKHESNF